MVNVRLQQAKLIRKHTHGKCPYCHKSVKSLEAHIKSSHIGEKLSKKK